MDKDEKNSDEEMLLHLDVLMDMDLLEAEGDWEGISSLKNEEDDND